MRHTLMKRILIIVENLPVPFDRRVWKEACALHNAGYDVAVLSPRGKGYSKRFEVLDGVHIYRHPATHERNSALGYIWEYACALLFELIYTWWIYATRGFDLVQGCNPPDTMFLIALPFKIFGVKFVFDHHDANPELYLSKYGRADLLYKLQILLETITYRVSDVVMATNESYKTLAITRGGLNPQDVFVVRNGPELSEFRLTSARQALKHGKNYLVGYVGNMSTQEGLDILIEVALNLKDRGRRDVHFTCVGGGPGLPELCRLVKEKGLSDSVNFTGRIPDADLLEILSTADLCVNPDKPCEMNNISTMIKIMEYMALGKPIVQFDLKEGRFSAGEASLYSSNEDQVTDFATKILWLLDHPEERQRMGEFGRRRVEQQLAWKYSVANLLAAYERAFDKGSHERDRGTNVNSFRDRATDAQSTNGDSGPRVISK